MAGPTAVVDRPPPYVLSDTLPADALATALLLASRPSLAKVACAEPLPSDVSRVIRIAAGSAETLRQAVQLTGKDPTFIYAAAVFYLEEVLWAEGSDCSRTLGVGPGASREAAADHARWLVGALIRHLGGDEPQSAQIDRVLAAWVAFNAGEDKIAPADPAPPVASAARKRRPTPLAAMGAAAAIVLASIALTGGSSPLAEGEHIAVARPLAHPISIRSVSIEARGQQPVTAYAVGGPRQMECASRECVP